MADTAVKIPFQEAAAPSTPASTKVVIYAKSDGLMYSKDDAGTETLMSGGAGGGGVATDAIWDAAGDLAVGTGANTAARLAIGATNGMALQRVSGAAGWALPPGFEFDYVPFTSPVAISATTEGAADTVVTANAVTHDGSTAIFIEFFCPQVEPNTGTSAAIAIILNEGATVLGTIAWVRFLTNNVTSAFSPVFARFRLTPTAGSHTYSVRAYRTVGNGAMNAGAGGTGADVPGYIRQVKA